MRRYGCLSRGTWGYGWDQNWFAPMKVEVVDDLMFGAGGEALIVSGKEIA